MIEPPQVLKPSPRIAAAATAVEVLKGVQDLFWPPLCVLCQKIGPSFFCDDCLSTLNHIHSPVCSKCGYPGVSSSCPDCGEAPWTHKFPCDSMRQVAAYEGLWRLAILEYKLNGKKCLLDALSNELLKWLDKSAVVWKEFDAVTPVPGTRKRGWELGYHHSRELALRVARGLSLPLIEPVRRLPGDDLAKKHLSRQERLETAKTLYALKKNPPQLYGKRILIIDDIVTTGATAQAVAAQLKIAGASKVRLLALARTL